ncbi:MAG TPA: sensor histidine kinase, partial [Erythrobacter sp.]|nr:sensor histidine kinase [Erythrobacter sp.]
MLVLAAATAVYAFIDSWVLDVAGASAGSASFANLFVGIYFIDLTLLGAWSALYYA